MTQRERSDLSSHLYRLYRASVLLDEAYDLSEGVETPATLQAEAELRQHGDAALGALAGDVQASLALARLVDDEAERLRDLGRKVAKRRAWAERKILEVLGPRSRYRIGTVEIVVRPSAAVLAPEIPKPGTPREVVRVTASGREEVDKNRARELLTGPDRIRWAEDLAPFGVRLEHRRHVSVR